jgi:hypothetical protein
MTKRLALIFAALLALTAMLPGSVAASKLLEDAGGADAASVGSEPGTSAPDGGTVDARWSGEYSVFRPKTHSVQKTNWYCVPASIQMMLNIVYGDSDRSRAGQDRYWRYAQDNSTYPITDNGADAGGWAKALRHWGAGDYSVGIHGSMEGALRAAASRMRATGKPAGIIVWGSNKGHGWVMTGFRASADPRATSDYSVSSIQAMGSLWPYGTINGKPYDPGPREWVGMAELRNKYTRFYDRNAPAWHGRWLTVLP